MTLNTAFAAIVGLATAALGASTAQAPAPTSPSRSARDGVYSEEQGKRGERIYGQECSRCHGPALDGGEAVPLMGSAFAANWKSSALDELFDKIRTSMPQDDPGRLTDQQSADVLAYILSVNQYPAGKAELTSEKEALKRIRLEPSKSP